MRPSFSFYVALFGGYILVWFSAFSLTADVGHPYLGVLLYHDIIADVYRVAETTPVWWNAVHDGILAYDDHLLAVNSQRLTAQPLATTLANALDEGHTTVEVALQRNGHDITVMMPIYLFDWYAFLDIKLPMFIISTGLLIIAYTSYSMRIPNPQLAKANRLLAWYVLLSMYAFGWHYPTIYWHSTLLGRLLDLGFITAVAVASVKAIEFVSVFPVMHRWWQRTANPLLALVAGVAIAALVLSRLLFWTIGRNEVVALLDALAFYTVFGLLFGLSVVYAVMRPLYVAFTRVSKRQRGEAILLGIAFFGILPVSSASVLNAWLEPTWRFFWGILDLRYLILTIPALVAILVLRYRPGVVPSLRLLFVTISGLSAIFATTMTSVLFSLLEIRNLSLITPIFTFLTFAFAGVSFFWATQGHWSSGIGRFLHHKRKTVNDMQLLFGNLREISFQRFSLEICNVLYNNLELASALLWLRQSRHDDVFTLQTAVPHDLPQVTFATAQLEHLIANEDMIIERQDMIHRCSLPELGKDAAYLVLLPLRSRESYFGFFMFGITADKVFDQHEIDSWKLIIEHCKTMLLHERAIGYIQELTEQLRRIDMQMNEFTQAQLHQLASSPRSVILKISEIRERWRDNHYNQNANRQFVFHDLQRIEKGVSDIEKDIRSLLESNTRPVSILESFRLIVEDRLDNVSKKFNVAIHKEIDNDIWQLLDKLTTIGQVAIELAIEEAITNAAKHAGVSEFTFEANYDDRSVVFRVIDRGCGFDAMHVAIGNDRYSGGRNVPSLLQQMDITWVVESAIGEGTIVTITVPESPVYDFFLD